MADPRDMEDRFEALSTRIDGVLRHMHHTYARQGQVKAYTTVVDQIDRWRRETKHLSNWERLGFLTAHEQTLAFIQAQLAQLETAEQVG